MLVIILVSVPLLVFFFSFCLWLHIGLLLVEILMQVFSLQFLLIHTLYYSPSNHARQVITMGEAVPVRLDSPDRDVNLKLEVILLIELAACAQNCDVWVFFV